MFEENEPLNPHPPKEVSPSLDVFWRKNEFHKVNRAITGY